ncbi:helix-turn-helix domain-containing protein [Rhodobacteraceae bacterium CCMM004]|nr:helix-turn-helix domain-containing protein [Rhodobacteraceae bacterium CCMM004]
MQATASGPAKSSSGRAGRGTFSPEPRKMADTDPSYPPPPAHVAPYVDALGIETAIEFLLAFGGSALYTPATPRQRGAFALKFGMDAARALSARADRLQPRVPLASRWLAQCLAAEGRSVQDICRILRTLNTTVRSYLKDNKVDGMA